MERFTFGGDTRIDARVRLILMDCFETLVEHDGTRHVPRLGVGDFLTHYCRNCGVPMAVVSDAPVQRVRTALGEAQLDRWSTAIFGRESGELLADGRYRKRLETALTALATPAADAVYIGDSPLDGEAATRAGVPFIRVPRSEDRTFSFAQLIHGVSRYRSSEFSNVFLESFRKP